jgi:hypothetical protein
MPTLQNWSFSPLTPYNADFHENTVDVAWRSGSGSSSIQNIVVDTVIKDIIGTIQATGYSNFKLKTFLIPSDNSYLGMSCLTSGGFTNIYSGPSTTLDYINGMSGRMVYYLGTLIGSGDYTVKGAHQIIGYNTQNEPVVLEEAFFNINYQNVVADASYAVPNRFAFNYSTGSSVPAPIKIKLRPKFNTTGVLTANENFVLSSPSPSVVIGVDGTGKPTATGVGNFEVFVALSSAYLSNPQTGPITNTLTYVSLLTSNYPESSANIIVTIEGTGNGNGDGENNLPTDLYFTATKNFIEPVLQTISFAATTGNNTVTRPDWLNVSTQFNAGILSLLIVPTATSEMNTGNYLEDLILTYELNGASVTKTIIIHYTLDSFLEMPYPVDSPAFTLDPLYLKTITNNVDTYFQFTANIRTFDFFTNVENDFTIPLKVLPYKGVATLNLSKSIHRLMRRFSAPNENEFQYTPALVNIFWEEKNLLTNASLRSVTVTNNFVAGLSRGIVDRGILNFNMQPNRVTKNSFAYLNLLVPAGDFEIQVIKNGGVKLPMSIPSRDTCVICKKITFENYSPGDVLSFALTPVGEEIGTTPIKTFIVFPEGLHSNTIVWEDEFLLQSVLEFTGTYSIKTEMERQSMKAIANLVEKLINVNTTEEVKLTINTGWLLKTDIDSVMSLMRSNKAWLVKDNQVIQLVPTSKTIKAEDSEDELIEYTLEFTINKSYNEETFSL